ncbi:MAG TPA: radical SAM protein [Vicinamibacteria bacterium]|nr:radical SAM protein [Vicinamibacteria bacterium]
MLTVNEVFFSIQGEGSRAGRPCAFVRLTGCPLRCVWCDTAYAFHEGARRDEEELLAELRRLPSRLLCLTGGEPLAQPAAFPFVTRVLDDGWEVVVETSGHVPLGPLDPRAVAILDVKTPGSGESARMHWENLDRLRAKDEAKFVIDGRTDYEWSRGVVLGRRLADRCSVLFSPVHGVLDPGTLGRWILADGLAVRLQVQLHKYLWPDAARGV